MIAGSIFDTLGLPFQFCLETLTHAFNAVPPLATTGAFGLAVIATTLIIRGALFPIFGWQLRTSRRIQAEQRLIAPQLAELRKKYKKEPQKLSAEMQKLYAEHQVSPFSSLSGCLPALVQMPVLIGLYRGILNATSNLPSGIGRGFLWIGDISESASKACCATRSGSTDWSQLLSHPAVLILPLMAAVLTFAQSRMMMPPPRPDMSDQERTMANVTRQMSVIFPVLIFVFSLNFPQGLAVYWVTGTMFMVLQQFHLVGWGSLKVPAWWPGANRVTSLSHPAHAAAGSPAQQAAAGTPADKAAAKAPTAARSATRAALVADGNGSKPAAAKAPAATVPTGAVNAPPARTPKKRTNKRRR